MIDLGSLTSASSVLYPNRAVILAIIAKTPYLLNFTIA